jgi:hypothetical protein
VLHYSRSFPFLGLLGVLAATKYDQDATLPKQPIGQPGKQLVGESALVQVGDPLGTAGPPRLDSPRSAIDAVDCAGELPPLLHGFHLLSLLKNGDWPASVHGQQWGVFRVGMGHLAR